MMSKINNVLIGIISTIAIYAISMIFSNKFPINDSFLPNSFVTHCMMLVLSLVAMYVFRERVNYKISLPKLRTIFKPIVFGILTTIIINVTMTLIANSTGSSNGNHPMIVKMTPLQVILFVFVAASIVEEILYRGFLLNILSPLKNYGIRIRRLKISLPVLISAVIFGLSHLILITTGADSFFVLRIVIFTTILGLLAGFFQEKYDNNIYAIIVHMSGNLMAVIGTLSMQ